MPVINLIRSGKAGPVSDNFKGPSRAQPLHKTVCFIPDGFFIDFFDNVQPPTGLWEAMFGSQVVIFQSDKPRGPPPNISSFGLRPSPVRLEASSNMGQDLFSVCLHPQSFMESSFFTNHVHRSQFSSSCVLEPAIVTAASTRYI